MITIEVNGRPLDAQPGEILLDALRRSGIRVPTLCYMDGLPPSGVCRLCVVEVEGQRNLVPSCSTLVVPGMKVRTHSPRAVHARKTIVELLLANHPDDCLYCVRNQSCQLQQIAAELGVRQRRYVGDRVRQSLDTSSPSLVRDPTKCVLCGRCVRVCEEIQGVGAIDFLGRGSRARVGAAFDEGLNLSVCVNCGQCVVACPAGALVEQSSIKEVVEALSNPHKVCVAQHAPAVSVSLGEEFGLPPGTDVAGAMTAALRRLGFARVFDTGFGADLMIMEQASELLHRIRHGGCLPMLTSCSPGWIKFVESFHPDFLENLSTCKSPQQMMGAVIKGYWAHREEVELSKLFSVCIMPCTATKFEVGRPEMGRHGMLDVDAVLTTRDLAKLIRMRRLDLKGMPSEPADEPFRQRSSAGKLFGVSGGVMEATLRTAHWLSTGRELDELVFDALRGLDGVKESRVNVDGRKIGVAVVSSLGHAGRLLKQIRAGRNDLHFIEVMTCPGGCVNGGGQPLSADHEAVKSRMQSLYAIDAREAVRSSHCNPAVQRFYEESLGAPLSDKSHELLHTHYHRREAMA